MHSHTAFDRMISIHAPARGATEGEWEQNHRRNFCPARGATGYNLVSTYNFNPRSREGSDLLRGCSRRAGGISIHAPARGATPLSTASLYQRISIHAPARGATVSSTHILLYYFNPRSREGSDILPGISVHFYTPISIHAPARGATTVRFDSPPILPISIHAPARGATSSQISPVGRSGNFNPRSREGSDICPSPANHLILSISIHAPARGATFARLLLIISYSDFNPRSREGSDHNVLQFGITVKLFQSTLPRGERQNATGMIISLGIISIHAPARGATKELEKSSDSLEISIHAPARGATFEHRHNAAANISIHAPARGATNSSILSIGVSHFNPRSREGSD